LQAWAGSLGGINYPLLSDFLPFGALSHTYGVFRKQDGHSERAIFVIDRDGILRYIDIHDIGEQPDNEVLRNVLREIDPEAASREPRQPAPDFSHLPHGGIVMYCTRWCPDCKNARAWLKDCGLAYTEVDIYETPGAEQLIRQWNGGRFVTPTFDIDGKIISEFNQPALHQVLGIE
jgi:glutaredoxin